jgi:large subunit ribosomal protein L23
MERKSQSARGSGVIRPKILGTGTVIKEQGAVVFEVAIDSNKPQIKEAVEALFGVKVKVVNTTITKGKVKRFRGQLGTRRNVKKAYVTLEEGDVIDVSSGALESPSKNSDRKTPNSSAVGADRNAASNNSEGGVIEPSTATEEEYFDLFVDMPLEGNTNTLLDTLKSLGLTKKDVSDILTVGDQLVLLNLTETEVSGFKEKIESNGGAGEVVSHGSEESFTESSLEVEATAAEWLAVAEEAKRRSSSLDATLRYVQSICDRVQGAQYQ